jgi:hypothetical protein
MQQSRVRMFQNRDGWGKEKRRDLGERWKGGSYVLPFIKSQLDTESAYFVISNINI